MYFWGMTGVGKSSLGKKMAKSLGWEFLDLDRAISKAEGLSVSSIFQERGEGYFRDIERKVLHSFHDKQKVIIATGGGTPCFHNNDNWMLEHGLCIWLDAPIGMIANRITNAKSKRPLLEGLEEGALLRKLDQMMDLRGKNYQKAHMIVSVNNVTDTQLASMLQSIIQETP